MDGQSLTRPLISTYLYCVLDNCRCGGLENKIYSSYFLLLYYDTVHLCVPVYVSNILVYMSTYEIYQVYVYIQTYKGLFP